MEIVTATRKLFVIILFSFVIQQNAVAEVTPNGSFSYSIPIEIPKGFGPLPKLSIDYNSNTGNGILGVGWRVGGLSRIHRMHYNNNTLEHDGAIDYDGTDTYSSSLDGVLLEESPGRYRSKKESFKRFESIGACGVDDGGPCSWIVTQKDGTKFYYGSATTVEAAGKNGSIREWPLDKVEDILGNIYTVTYEVDADNLDYRIASIDYSNNTGLSGYALTFNYEIGERPDPIVNGYPGINTKIKKRLEEIVISGVNVVLNRYKFEYETEVSPLTQRSRLANITITDATGAKSISALPDYNFTWDAASGSGYDANYLDGNFLKQTNSPDVTPKIVCFCDVDGDGKDEVLMKESGPGTSERLWMMDSATNRIGDSVGSISAGMRNLRPIDIDLDGQYEVVGQIGTNLRILKQVPGTGSYRDDAINYQIPTDHSLYTTLDVNGDGRKDILLRSYADYSYSVLVNETQHSSAIQFSLIENWIAPDVGTRRTTVRVFDINHDGKDDILIFDSSTNEFLLAETNFDGTASSGPIPIDSDMPQEDTTDPSRSLEFGVGDFNGDNLVDIVYYIRGQDTKFKFLINKGDNTFQYKESISFSQYTPIFNTVADMNGDGKSDIIYYRDTKITIYYGTDDITNIKKTVSDSGKYPRGSALGDYDGDGSLDVFYYVQEEGSTGLFGTLIEYWYDLFIKYSPNFGRPDSLIGIENAIGGKIEIDYLPGTHVDRYVYDNTDWDVFETCDHILVATEKGFHRAEQGYGFSCGVPDNNPTEVVTSITEYSGSNDPELVNGITKEYHYLARRYYPGVTAERVFLGYKAIWETNLATMHQTVTTYNQAVPYHGTVNSKRELVRVNGTICDPLLGCSGTNKYSELNSITYMYEHITTPQGTEYLSLDSTVTINQNAQTTAPDPNAKRNGYTNFYEYDEYNNQLSDCKQYSYNPGINPTCDKFVYDTDPALLSRGIVARLTEKSITAAASIPDFTGGRSSRMAVADPVYAKTELRYEPGNDNVKQKCEWVDVENVFSCTSFDYDPVVNGRLSDVTDAENHTTSFEYDSVYGAYIYKTILPLVADAPTQTDANGNPLPPQRQENITKVDLAGRIIEEIDVNGNTTTTQRDEFGRPYLIRKPDGGTTFTRYEDFGSTPSNILPIHQGAQRIYTSTHFESSNRKMENWDYFDGFSYVWRSTRTGDNNTRIIVENVRDSAGRLQCRTKPYISGDPVVCEESIDYYFDGKINTVTKLGTPTDRVARYSYVPPSTSSISTTGINYSKLVSVRNADNEVTTKIYNELNQLVLVEDAAGQHTWYEYDPLGNPSKVVLPDLSEVITDYDSLGRKREFTDKTTGTTLTNYDLVGNIKDQTDGAGAKIAYQYDELNRTKLADYPWDYSTPDVTYTYDLGEVNNGIGQLGSVIDGAGTYEVTQYTKMGYPEQTTRLIDGAIFSKSIGYDFLGRVTNETLGGGEFDVGYRYTNSGNLDYVTVNGNIYANWDDYTTYGKPQKLTYNNGVVTDYTYYNNGQLHTMRSSNGATELVNLEYFYYDDGNIGRIEDRRTGATINETQAFTYDSLNRLLTADAVGTYGSKSYLYDSIGNIKKNASLTLNYQNGLPTSGLSDNGETLNMGYKPNGNMAYKTTYNLTSTDYAVLTYSADSKLIHHEFSNASTLVKTTMKYDYAGNRVKKHVANVRPTKEQMSTFYINDTFEVRRAYFNNNTQRTVYIKGNGQTLASVTTDWSREASPLGLPAGAYYYLNDHIGSSAVITDATGAEVNRTVYMPYGLEDTAHSSGASVTDVKYTGQELDRTTGLYNYGARYYDPVIARFITPDTIIPDAENPQAYNRYSYVYNNPINLNDPSGNDPWIPGGGDDDNTIVAPWDDPFEEDDDPMNRYSDQSFTWGYSEDTPKTYQYYFQTDATNSDKGISRVEADIFKNLFTYLVWKYLLSGSNQTQNDIVIGRIDEELEQVKSDIRDIHNEDNQVIFLKFGRKWDPKGQIKGPSSGVSTDFGGNLAGSSISQSINGGYWSISLGASGVPDLKVGPKINLPNGFEISAQGSTKNTVKAVSQPFRLLNKNVQVLELMQDKNVEVINSIR